MHLEHNNLVTAPIQNLGRGAKHPPLARQPSYKMAQQQTVMPQVLHNSDMVAPLPWEQTPENSNFLLQIANTCTLTTCTTSVMSSSTSMSMTATSMHHQHVNPNPFPTTNHDIHPIFFNPPAQWNFCISCLLFYRGQFLAMYVQWKYSFLDIINSSFMCLIGVMSGTWRHTIASF